MRQLTLEQTQTLVHSYVKSFGGRGAARKLTEHGYKSPEGHEIRQGHITRIMSGSYTCIQAPEEPVKTVVPAPAPSPIVARPPVAEPYPAHCKEQGPAPASPSETPLIDLQPPRQNVAVDEELIEPDMEDLSTLQEDEAQMPALVPAPGDHSNREHSHLERDVRVSAVFNRRGPVEFDEDRGDFFGLPRLRRQPQKVITKPHEPRSYAQLPMSPMEPYRLQSKKSERVDQ